MPWPTIIQVSKSRDNIRKGGEQHTNMANNRKVDAELSAPKVD